MASEVHENRGLQTIVGKTQLNWQVQKYSFDMGELYSVKPKWRASEGIGMGDETHWKHVGVKVEQSKYDSWQDYLEESDYGSMSNLIRTAVEREMQQDSTHSDSGADVTGEHVAELVDTVEQMSSRMDSLEGSVNDATRSMRVGGVSEETTTAVWKAIPQGAAQATTAEGVAEGLDVDADAARVALEALHESMGNVVQKREVEDIDVGDEITVEDHSGRKVHVGGAEGFKRRNPLWWRVE